MPQARSFNAAFRILNKEFSAKARRSFLSDIRGQLEEDDEIAEILSKSRNSIQHLALTFDRRKNDTTFSYPYFDMVLVALDAISGGNGIYKPSNQMRALQWNGSRKDLLRVLRYLRQNNSQIKFKRALILPFPTPPTGYGIDRKIYMR